MVDAVTLERMGVPTAVIAFPLLINTTGRAVARMQGAPNLPFVVVREAPGSPSNMLHDFTSQELEDRVIEAVDRVIGILTLEQQPS